MPARRLTGPFLAQTQIQGGAVNIQNSYMTLLKKGLYTLFQQPEECSNDPVFKGNTFQDLPQLRETADNTERYI
jgi:hypothetical protein